MSKSVKSNFSDDSFDKIFDIRPIKRKTPIISSKTKSYIYNFIIFLLIIIGIIVIILYIINNNKIEEEEEI